MHRSEMISYPNLLIIAATSGKSGKTTMACRIIEQFSNRDIIAIRVSPHFHEKTEGLLSVDTGEGYCVSLETNSGSAKDTSRMLRSGASKVYLVETMDDLLGDVFQKLMKGIPESTPVVCESPALRDHFEPGLFILMNSTKENKRQDLSHLRNLPHLEFNLDAMTGKEDLPIEFRDGRWREKN